MFFLSDKSGSKNLGKFIAPPIKEKGNIQLSYSDGDTCGDEKKIATNITLVCKPGNNLKKDGTRGFCQRRARVLRLSVPPRPLPRRRGREGGAVPSGSIWNLLAVKLGSTPHPLPKTSLEVEKPHRVRGAVL